MPDDATAYPELAALEARGDVAELIGQVPAAVVADPAGALADPVVQAWLARRWTALFVQRASLDEQAVATARGARTRDRPDRGGGAALRDARAERRFLA